MYWSPFSLRQVCHPSIIFSSCRNQAGRSVLVGSTHSSISRRKFYLHTLQNLKASSTDRDTRDVVQSKKLHRGRGWNILFLGSDQISIDVLQVLLDSMRYNQQRSNRPRSKSQSSDSQGREDAKKFSEIPEICERENGGERSEENEHMEEEEDLCNNQNLIARIEVVVGPDKKKTIKKGEKLLQQFALREGLHVHQAPPGTRFRDWTLPRFTSLENSLSSSSSPSPSAPLSTCSTLTDALASHSVTSLSCPLSTAPSSYPCNPTSIPESFDFMVVASFPFLIPFEMMSSFHGRALNMHPSCLPLYRGPAPMLRAMLNGDKEIGISIITIAEAFDEGRVLARDKVQVPERVKYPEVASSVAKKGGELLLKVLQDYPRHLHLSEQQDDAGSTYAAKISREELVMRWGEMSAAQAERIYYSLAHMGLHSYLPTRKRLRHVQFHRVETVVSLPDDVEQRVVEWETENKSVVSPGTVIHSATRGKLFIKCLAISPQTTNQKPTTSPSPPPASSSCPSSSSSSSSSFSSSSSSPSVSTMTTTSTPTTSTTTPSQQNITNCTSDIPWVSVEGVYIDHGTSLMTATAFANGYLKDKSRMYCFEVGRE